MKTIVFTIKTPDRYFLIEHDEEIRNALMTLFEAFGYGVVVELSYEEAEDEEM